ncbi:HAD family hydrolase [Methanolobus profundi]|uniref:HAD family hydrolase n=1 Tax=Methanolobus profundi TaxID=487685 RepID=UPI000B89F6AA|nr:HAD family phosphatase [Methanolobus profundi]
MIEALIFDMDGVLIDSMHLHSNAWKTAFAEAGIEIDEKDIFHLEGENDTGIVKSIMNSKNIDPCRLEDILTTIPSRKHEIFDIDKAVMFEGMDKCLKKLKNKFKLAVVSGSDKVVVDTIMERIFPGIFNAIVSGDDTINGKPDPDPYNKAVEMLGVEKENCIVIENAILGVTSAKNAGIFTVGSPTYLDRKELEHADIVLQDHAELYRFLELLMRT